MSVKTVYQCDVCGDEPKNGDTSAWRIISMQPMSPVAEEAVPLGAPAVTPPAAPPGPVMVCHKPSCLTRWAKEQNEAK